MGMNGFLWCMSRQQRLDPQLLDAWNGLGEAGSRGKERKPPGSKQQEIPWMTRIPYVLRKMVVHWGWRALAV